MRDILIAVISSEKTWGKLSKWGFDKKLRKRRTEFDLAVVFNGYDSDGIKFYKEFVPEYFFLRENSGYDVAAMRHFLQLIPVYNNTIILHDDHWFEDDSWLDRILELILKNPEVDILGNVLYNQPIIKSEQLYEELGISKLIGYNYVDYLHGMSGIFNAKAIRKLKTFPLPEKLSSDKAGANLGERIFSNIIFSLGLKLVELPSGPFKFLKHGDGNERNYFFSMGDKYFMLHDFNLAKKYFYEYYELCLKENFTNDFIYLYTNLAYVHFQLNEKQAAKEKIIFLKNNFPDAELSPLANEILSS